jgi:DNA-binding response OmpR family regulator
MIQKRVDGPTNDLSVYPARGLVVEDSRAVRAMVSRFLIARHIIATESSDGLCAWHLLMKQRFDVVITDVEMPLWTGLDLVHAMRTSHNLWIRSTPVIVTSSLKSEAINDAVTSFPSTYFMPKPLEVAELDVMLRLVATMHRMRRPPILNGLSSRNF